MTLTGKSVKRDVALSLGELQETISIRSTPNEPQRPRQKPQRRASTIVPDSSATSKAARPMSSGGRVRPPRKIKDVKPVYPDERS